MLKFWCVQKCVFDISHRMEQTLCLQPMAGRSAWHYFRTKKLT